MSSAPDSMCLAPASREFRARIVVTGGGADRLAYAERCLRERAESETGLRAEAVPVRWSHGPEGHAASTEFRYLLPPVDSVTDCWMSED